MKNLLSRKVRRGTKLTEWTPAEHHLTMDGLREFEARQIARRDAAQPKPPPDMSNVQALPTVRRRKA